MRPLRVAKKQKKLKEKKEKLRDVTSHAFAQATHVELVQPKVSCGLGPGCSQP